jgi:hypothetical protein
MGRDDEEHAQGARPRCRVQEDLAIQIGRPREKALAALLEAAWSLVTRPDTQEAKPRPG